MKDLKQSSTAQPLLFFMALSSDGKSPATGLSPTVTLSKNGGSFASPAGAVTEIANGWYKVAGNATDTATLGPLVLHASVATADNADVMFNVVKYDPQLNFSGTADAGATGGLPLSIDALGRVDVRTADNVSDVDNPVDVSNEAIDAIALAVEAQLIDDVSGDAFRQAIVDKINEIDPDLGSLTISAIADATRDAILNRILSGNHDTAGTTGKLIQNLNATVGSRAVAGDAMTLTTGERTSVGTAVWASASRTLTSFGTLVADIWASASRTLTDIPAALLALFFTRDTTKVYADAVNGSVVKEIVANASGGGGGNIVFTGANAVTITVTDDATPTPNVIPGAKVRLTLASQSQLQQTNGSGIAQTSTNVLPALDDGTYSYAVTAGMEYEGTTGTIVVDATHKAFTVVLVSLTLPIPSAGQCVGTLLVVDENGAPESEVEIFMQAIAPPSGTGYAYDGVITTHTSDDNGLVTRLFPAGGVYYDWWRSTSAVPQKFRFQTAAEGEAFEVPNGVG